VHEMGFCGGSLTPESGVRTAVREALALSGTKAFAVAVLPLNERQEHNVIVFAADGADRDPVAFYVNDTAIVRTQIGCNTADALLGIRAGSTPFARYVLP